MAKKQQSPSRKYMIQTMLYAGLTVLVFYMGILNVQTYGLSGVPYLLVGAVGVVVSIISLIKYRRISLLLQLVDGGTTKIDELSVATHLSYDRITKEMNSLIQKGIYSGIHINHTTREIEKASNHIDFQPVQNITCPNCRATTSDKNGVCEFCGASLK